MIWYAPLIAALQRRDKAFVATRLGRKSTRDIMSGGADNTTERGVNMDEQEQLRVPVEVVGWHTKLGSRFQLVVTDDTLQFRDSRDAVCQVVELGDVEHVEDNTSGKIFKKPMVMIVVRREGWLGPPPGDVSDDGESVCIRLTCRNETDVRQVVDYLEKVVSQHYYENVELPSELRMFTAGLLSASISEIVTRYGTTMREFGFGSGGSQRALVVRCLKKLIMNKEVDGVVDEENDQYVSSHGLSSGAARLESASQQVERLASLRKEGVISTEEFQAFSKRFQSASEVTAGEYVATIRDLYSQFQRGAMSEGNYRAGLWSLLDKLDRKA